VSVPAKLASFAVALVATFGAAAVAGSAFGPDAADREPATAMGGHGAAERGAHEAPARPVRGLSIAEGGLRLVVDDAELRRGATEPLRFRIVGEDGETVRDFDVEHEKRMHLIVARRDLTGFQHLHPQQDADGTWTTDVRLPDAGSYRLFADFVHDADPYTLASDLRVDGRATLVDLPEPAPLADADAGYQVRLDNDPVRPGEPAALQFTVHRDGRAVAVEPYLGAGGHLVTLREGDLAFLHVHPEEHAEGDAVGFEATFPTEGRYGLFLQFKHDGRVHTAPFTLEVG
jgi:hypothetical protein